MEEFELGNVIIIFLCRSSLVANYWFKRMIQLGRSLTLLKTQLIAASTNMWWFFSCLRSPEKGGFWRWFRYLTRHLRTKAQFHHTILTISAFDPYAISLWFWRAATAQVSCSCLREEEEECGGASTACLFWRRHGFSQKLIWFIPRLVAENWQIQLSATELTSLLPFLMSCQGLILTYSNIILTLDIVGGHTG